MLFILVGIIVLLPISGCSTPIIAENAVFDDIKSSDPRCSTFDFIYDSMEITKRLTDEDNKRDTVYAKFICHNEEFEYTAEYIVTYILYNDGWKFENCQIANASYIASLFPDENLAKNAIRNKYGTEATIEEKLTDTPNICSFTASSTEQKGKYLSAHNSYNAKYEFTPEDGWCLIDLTQTPHYEWEWDSIIGTWKRSASEIEILEVNSKDITINYSWHEWIYDYTGSGTYTMKYNANNENPYYYISVKNSNGYQYFYFIIAKDGVYKTANNGLFSYIPTDIFTKES